MFSPGSTIQSASSIRNPRRRHRTTSEDSIGVRQSSKRQKRSSLTPSTFEPLPSTKSNGHATQLNGSLASKKPGLDQRTLQKECSTETTTSLAVRSRGSKRGERERRPIKHGEGAVLTKNDHYIISKDPNIPEELSDVIRRKEPWHVQFADNLGHAVALTHTKAIVWRYAAKPTTIDSSKTLTIRLPDTPSHAMAAKDPLPQAVLVHDSGAGELALLVVMPTGKISYWESVFSAASADLLRQKKQGLHGSVSGVLSSETISSITEAEPDGFVLTSSAGRIFHVSVRDPQGRPAITTVLLKGSGVSSGGFLGGIKSVFSGAGWRKDIAAIRAGPPRGKSRRHCIVVTTLGLFQVWDLVRHSTKTLDFELDARSYILDAMTDISSDTKEKDEFSILDFTLFPNESKTAELEGHHLLVLTALRRQHQIRYRLVDLRIHDESLEINVIHPITCWDRVQNDDASRSTFKTRLLLPEPAHSAFVIFDKCLVMVSLSNIEETPNSQLQMESNLLSDPFQDVLIFARDADYHVVGCTVDPSDRESGKATCLMFVDGFGLVHAGAFPAKEGEAADERRAAACRSKIEQAVFYGNTTGNLLDFRTGLDVAFWEDKEIEVAAIKINDSILNCKSKYVATISPSMETQLKQRAMALTELIRCVKKWKLKRQTRWYLLWSAEKMAAAKAIWQLYTSHLASKRPKEKVLLSELVDMMSEKFKHENQPKLGETDVVRHYLINDISGIELVIPWAEQALEELYTEGVRDPAQQALLISQANDIQIGALEAAFRFREAHADIYGIGRDVVEDGIYQGGYEELPDFWTSIPETVVKVKELADLSRESAIHNATSPGEGEVAIDLEVLMKLAKDTPRLVNLCCKVYDERCRVLKSRPDAQSQADGDALFLAFLQIRKELFMKLVDIELPDEGLQLAEKYSDVAAIASVITKVNDVLQERLEDPSISEDEQLELEDREANYREKVQGYFQTYGYKWAEAFYSNHLQTGTLSQLVDQNGPYMTEFLRSRPDLVKLNWLNEVCVVQNFKKATENLLAAQGQDTSLWNKKIVLSMGKLAILSAKEKEQIDDETVIQTVRKADRCLAIISAQERLYAYTRPLLRSAIDETAAVDLAMESFGSRVRKRPVLSKALRQNFEKLVERRVLEPEELVDTLTLIAPTDQVVDDEDFAGERFFLALHLLNLSKYEDYERKGLQERIVWRRCLVQDDWASLNQTEMKDDMAVARETEETALFKTLKAGFSDGLFNEYIPLPPSELLGAGTNPSSLRESSRYSTVPDATLKALATEMSTEEKALSEAIKKGRLEMWWPGVIEGAKAAVRKEADDSGEEMAGAIEEARELEEKGMNGTVNGHALGLDGREVDGQGDMVME